MRSITTRVPLSQIRPNEDNPRLIKEEKFKKLVKSLREFPEMIELRPIVVDEGWTVLGGNMRLRALQELKVQEAPVTQVEGLTPEQKREFIIKDNASFGDWDWDILANQWDAELLPDWGLDVWIPDLDPDQLGEGFSLADGEKAPFQSLTFKLADQQAGFIQDAIQEAQHLEEFKYLETLGNDNRSGNALYFIVWQWAEQRK